MTGAEGGIGEMVAALIASGAEPRAAAIAVARAFELGAQATKPVVSSRQASNARYYQDNREKILARAAERRAASEIQPPLADHQKPPRKTPAAKRPRATRITADWKPTEEMVVFASGLGFEPEAIARLAEEFRDFWLGAPKGQKLDWFATWRNRCREVAARRGLTGPPTLFSSPNNPRNRSEHHGPPSSIDYSPDASRRAAIADATFAGVARTTRRLVERRMAERQNRADAAQGPNADAAATGRNRTRHCGTVALPAPRADSDGEPGGDGRDGIGIEPHDDDATVVLEN